MFKTKITRIAVIALLALGVSSPALAVPVINVSYGTTLVTDPSDPSAQLRNYNFTISYASCVDSGVPGDPCAGGGGDMISFDVLFPFADVISIVDVVTDPDWFSDPSYWFDSVPGPDLEAQASADYVGASPLFPLALFSLTVQVDFGAAIGSPDAPMFDFYTGDFFDELLFYVTAQYDANLDGILPPAQVPEPGTLALLGLGLLGMGAARRRKA